MIRPETLFDEAMAAYQHADWERAAELLAVVLIAKPDHAAAWVYRGLCEDHMGRAFNALTHFNHALDLEPNRADNWCNYGVTLGKLGAYGEAEKAFRKALEFGDAFEPHQNLGDLYIRLMRLDDAEREFRAAIRCKPDNTEAHANLGGVLLALGKWREGFAEKQHRHKLMIPPRARQFYPVWEGQDLTGKAILLYPEGGYGDQISNMRYAEALARSNHDAVVILEVRPQLYRIARRSLIDVSVIASGDDVPMRPDYCCALSDVPMWLGTTPGTVPGANGYLSAANKRSLKLPDGFKVGLCWLSGRRPLQPWTDRMARNKSIPLEMFAMLVETGARLISLQYDRADAQWMRRLGIVDVMDDVHDFADTARLIKQCDLVISVDSAVAHLAGALGHPVWNLIRFDEIVTYPPCAVWYDSMTFYRQQQPGDWSAPLAKVAADLSALVEKRAAA